MATTLPVGAVNLIETLQTASPQSLSDIAALVALAATSAVVFYKPWDRPDPDRHVWFEKPQLKNGGASQAQKKSRNIATVLEELVCIKLQKVTA